MKTAKTKEQLFVDLITILNKLPASKWPEIADEAGICLATLYNWCHGTTFNPRLNTVIKVAKALGYEIQLVRTAKLKKVA